MSSKKKLKTNNSQNFILKGLNSVQIGLYFLLGAYILKSSLQGFISDGSLMGMMSIQIIEVLGLSVLLLVFLFSTLAVFYSSRRNSRRSGFKVWNANSKKHFWFYLILIILGIILLSILNGLGYTVFLAPAFLLYLGLILAFLNKKKQQPYYLLASISAFLSLLVFMIPSYWYSALLIVGVGFLAYGIVVRK